ncbi:MAG: PAS domain-containing protein [Minwuia sp.]|uniref:PAS domain-containing protein n=1 Tax=Minwuia sp. TaxID=2493630 RepID=UPI003A8370A7
MSEDDGDPRPGPMGPKTQELLDYWNGLRGDREMPSRKEIDPVDLRRLLPHIMITEIEPDTGRFLFRLVGTRVTVMYGNDNTGKYLDEVYFGRHREAITRSYVTAYETRAPHHCWMKFTNREGLEFDMERLILPLSSDGQRVDKLISLLDIHENQPR